MSEKCVFEFSGYITDLVIAPISRDKAEHWLTRSKDDLIQHAYDSENQEDYVELDNIEAGFLPGATFMEGCEIHKGDLVIKNADGVELKMCSLTSDEFGDEVDDTQTIDPTTHLLDGGPTLIRVTQYRGDVTYNPTKPVHLDDDDDGEKNWYVFLADIGRGMFISNLFVDNEEVSPEGTGAYESQEVWLNVPDESGNLRQVYHRLRCEL